jgi:hypothetical protein
MDAMIEAKIGPAGPIRRERKYDKNSFGMMRP